MEFDLGITVGNEAMTTTTDLAEALRTVANTLEHRGLPNEGTAQGFIRDRNGNVVGSWQVTAPEPDPIHEHTTLSDDGTPLVHWRLEKGITL